MLDDFDKDFGVDEWHGTNVFIRDGDQVYRTYFVNNRGDEQMGSTWNYLDITALGRQEKWEDSPEGYPQDEPYAVVDLARRAEDRRASPRRRAARDRQGQPASTSSSSDLAHIAGVPVEELAPTVGDRTAALGRVAHRALRRR